MERTRRMLLFFTRTQRHQSRRTLDPRGDSRRGVRRILAVKIQANKNMSNREWSMGSTRMTMKHRGKSIHIMNRMNREWSIESTRTMIKPGKSWEI
jgi:hypothetical protein